MKIVNPSGIFKNNRSKIVIYSGIQCYFHISLRDGVKLLDTIVTKAPGGCGTKQPFLERDKTADTQNGTKQPIFKTGQNSRFLKRDKTVDFQKYLAYLLYGSVASLPSPSSNIEAWPYGTSLRFASLLHLGH